jgi:hypothetical protein
MQYTETLSYLLEHNIGQVTDNGRKKLHIQREFKASELFYRTSL